MNEKHFENIVEKLKSEQKMISQQMYTENDNSSL